MDDATRVEWREWSEAAFEEARAADVPVLLSLTATWCDHCHEMDEETYAEPTIAANVDDAFVPVRVDVDRRPRVRDRYNMGGFPSTVFLAPDGSLLTGAGYLGPDGMRQVIDSVRDMWATKGADAGRIPRALGGDEPPSGELSGDVESAMVATLRENYDETAGGWGGEPKFPLPDALEFALKRDRDMALRCFDAVGANLLDEHDGGFYRFATGRDWSGIQHEKILDANAALIRAFANAYCYSGREEYREPAERTIDYLTTTLWNEGRGAFAGSQAPGAPDSYTLAPSDREAADDPPVDDTVYAGANALAVDGLLTYYAYTDDDRPRRFAERALSHLRERLVEDGVVVHHRDDGSGDVANAAESTDGARSAEDGHSAKDDDGTGRSNDAGPRCLLANQARTLAALTTAGSVLGADVLDEARSIADETIASLRDGTSFVDGPIGGPGLLDRSIRPVDANVELADALLDLAVLTGEKRYRAVARETVEAFAGASDRFGVRIARYASIAARLLEGPLVVRVAAPAGSDLHRAALRIADHEKVVVPDANEPEMEAETARVERGDRVSDPAKTPEELGARVRAVLE